MNKTFPTSIFIMCTLIYKLLAFPLKTLTDLKKEVEKNKQTKRTEIGPRGDHSSFTLYSYVSTKDGRGGSVTYY